MYTTAKPVGHSWLNTHRATVQLVRCWATSVVEGYVPHGNGDRIAFTHCMFMHSGG